MKFGAVPVADALGATAVHSIREGNFVLKKGTLIGPSEVAALKAAGVKEITVARLDPGDVSEDQAAADIATAIKGEGVRADRAFTGRCNLFAESAGVLVVDKAAIDALNRIDEAVTLATLPAYKPVVEGEMIATVKIIPFAVPGAARDQAVCRCGEGEIGHSRRTLQVAQGRRGVDVIARPVAESYREDAEDHCRTHCAGWREHYCRAACAARTGGARASD